MRRGDEKAEKGNRDNLGVSLQKKRSIKKRVWKGLWALGNVFILKNSNIKSLYAHGCDPVQRGN